jgi:hypothetical protein
MLGLRAVSRAVRIVLIVVALLETVGGAQADEQDPKEIARGRVREGNTLYDQGRHEEALGRYREAYAAYPSPKILFNVGQTLLRLGRDVEAAAAFDRFLADGKDTAPELRQEAEKTLAGLKARVAFVLVSAEPEGAELTIDSHDHGRTPLPRAVAVAPGRHQIVLTKPGWTPFVYRIEARAGEETRVEARLTPVSPEAAPNARRETAPPPPLPAARVPPARAPSPPPPAAAIEIRRSPQEGAAREAPSPFYRRWWFWSAAAVALAGGVAAGIWLRADRDATGPTFGTMPVVLQ